MFSASLFRKLAYAIITGSAIRIGREISLHLAKSGFDLILHYHRSSDEVKELKEDVESLGRECVIYSNDFSDCDNYFNPAVSLNSVALLINNACVFKNDSIENPDKENFLKHMMVNFFSPMEISAQLFKKSSMQSINIINIVDNIIFKLPDNFSSYYFSKLCLAKYTKIAAKLYAPKIRVNAIALGHVIKNNFQTQSHFEKSKNNTILKRLASIKEINNMIDCILKSHSMTGEVMSLDGGGHLNNSIY